MTKEQKAIQQLKYLLFIYKDDLEDKYLPTGELFNKDFEAVETVLNMLKEKDEEIEKKDKSIDLMTEYIVSCHSEEGICLKVEDSCYDYAGQNGKTCDTCIKQYFERKAEQSSSINKTQEKN